MDEMAQRDVLDRLARIEGQVRGLARMVQEERACDQVLTQIAAVTAALEKVGLSVMTHSIDQCLALPPEQARATIKQNMTLLSRLHL